jgi:hypothetical protein
VALIFFIFLPRILHFSLPPIISCGVSCGVRYFLCHVYIYRLLIVDVSGWAAGSDGYLVAVLVFQQRVISQFVITSDVWCVPCANNIIEVLVGHP